MSDTESTAKRRRLNHVELGWGKAYDDAIADYTDLVIAATSEFVGIPLASAVREMHHAIKNTMIQISVTTGLRVGAGEAPVELRTVGLLNHIAKATMLAAAGLTAQAPAVFIDDHGVVSVRFYCKRG
jgi:hypothetical protein